MAEIKKSWSIPVGKPNLITVFADTKQIISHRPDQLADIIIDVTITEITKD